MSAGEDIRRQDEVLELLFWLEGERLEQDATLPQMCRLLTYDEAVVSAIVARLCERGDVVAEAGEPVCYRLTTVGKREAGRRFQETFDGLLSQGHGECSDPNCDCMDDPASCRHYNQPHVHQGST